MLALSGCVVDSEPRDPPAAGGTPSPSTTATDSPGETSTASPSETSTASPGATTDSPGDDGAYEDRDGFSIVLPPTWGCVRMSRAAADGSTLPLPVPADQVTTTSAQVDGVSATVLTTRDGADEPRPAL